MVPTKSRRRWPASPMSCSPSAHALPPIRLLSNVKTQRRPTMPRCIATNPPTCVQTTGVSTASHRSTLHSKTHARTHARTLTSFPSVSLTSSLDVFRFFFHKFVLPKLACTYIRGDQTCRWRVTADAHMLRAELARDASAHRRVTAALKMKGKKRKGEKKTYFSAGCLATAAIKDGAQRIVQTSCERAQ